MAILLIMYQMGKKGSRYKEASNRNAGILPTNKIPPKDDEDY